jgi:hypothetical protein
VIALDIPAPLFGAVVIVICAVVGFVVARPTQRDR